MHRRWRARRAWLLAPMWALACGLVCAQVWAQAATPAPTPASTPASISAPVQVTDDRGRSVTFAKPPLRIVSLLPSLTETVCALQACDKLVGTDRHSNWPKAVQGLPKLGGLEDTQIERIVTLKPDLVLAAVSARAVDRLASLGLTVLALEPQNWAGTQRSIQSLARVLGNPAAGQVLIATLNARVDAAAARVPAAWRTRSVYFEVGLPYAAGEASFVGELLARLQLGNVVPASLGPFPQLNPEFVIRAQPGVMMGSSKTVVEMKNRPGWRALKALQTNSMCGFDTATYDTLVRPGPRLADAAEAIANCLQQLPGPLLPAAPAVPARLEPARP
jgi:iron complex transport system substrate-binding protein